MADSRSEKKRNFYDGRAKVEAERKKSTSKC